MEVGWATRILTNWGGSPEWMNLVSTSSASRAASRVLTATEARDDGLSRSDKNSLAR